MDHRTRTLTDVHRQQLRRRLIAAAYRLRTLAEAVDREAHRLAEVPRPGATSFVAVVANVQHEVTWAIANLSLPDLARDAAEADRDRIEESK